jgi:hypothetical protein
MTTLDHVREGTQNKAGKMWTLVQRSLWQNKEARRMPGYRMNQSGRNFQLLLLLLAVELNNDELLFKLSRNTNAGAN